MLKIAMCDDDEVTLKEVGNKIKAFMESKAIPHEINTFVNSTEFLESCTYKEDGYQIVLLDIVIGDNEDGFILAGELRKRYEDKVIIIFLTDREEYVFRCFEYSPFAFLRKRKVEEELVPILDRAVFKVSKGTNNVKIFKTLQGEIKIDLSQIRYVERIGRKTLIMTDRDTYETNYQLVQIDEMVKGQKFMMTHRSIIVNMKYVYSIDKDMVTLENNIQLPLSRHRSKEVKLAFNKH